MRFDHKFLRTHGGVTSFAHVTVCTAPGAWTISWSDDAVALRAAFGAATEAAIVRAAAALRASGGAPLAIQVEAIGHSFMDTTSDAVACAAAIAAWGAWGGDVSEANVTRDSDQKWTVHFADRNG